MTYNSDNNNNRRDNNTYSKNNGMLSAGAQRISNKPFRDSKKFMYFDRHGTERYIYSTAMPQEQSFTTFILKIIIVLLIAVLGICVSGVIGKYASNEPLEHVYKQNTVHIMDDAEIIGNNSGFEETLSLFEYKTGVCPYVITVCDSEWKGKNSSLNDYAESVYLDKFNDDQHFLIICSESDGLASVVGVYRYSIGKYQGRDTQHIITQRDFIKFENTLKKYLKDEEISTGVAFNKSFTDLLNDVTSDKHNSFLKFILLIVTGVWILIVLRIAIKIVTGYVISKREYMIVMDDNTSNNISDRYLYR